MTQKKKVKYIKRPNLLKMKAGHGGIPSEILARAEQFIVDYDVDFRPEAQRQIKAIKKARELANKQVEETKKPVTNITGIMAPIMTLKAHGGMFKYHLISDIADICLQFLEALNSYNREALQIVHAHEKTIESIIQNNLTGDGGQEGYNLVMELHRACKRYFEKYPAIEAE